MKKGIKRRDMIRGTISSAAAVSFARPASGNDRTRRPNIIFIMADDLGYADLSCYGRKEYTTPHIDSLAAEGVRLTNAYANSPVCSATRVALMTGNYQYRLRVGLEEPLTFTDDIGLPPEQATLPSILKNAGYRTSLVGKWHLGSLPNFGPLKSGYETFYGIRGGGVDYFTYEDLRGDKDLWDNAVPVDETGYLTELLGKKAIEVIEERADGPEPFFLSLHFTAPHWPWEGPDDSAESRRLDESGRPGAIAHFDGGSMDTYAEMVVSLDKQVGSILAALKRKRVDQDTIVVFTSDNGGERFSDVWPFTGRKGELLEGGLRIPSIIRWPRSLPKGVVSDQPIITMDWVPTLLKAAGIEYPDPAQFDGCNIMPALSGAGKTFDRELYWRHLNFDQQACRIGNWKYLKIFENEFLFDLSKDPLERANLKSRYPDIFARLVSAFATWNATMLPLTPEASTRGLSGEVVPDHFGVEPIDPPVHPYIAR